MNILRLEKRRKKLKLSIQTYAVTLLALVSRACLSTLPNSATLLKVTIIFIQQLARSALSAATSLCNNR